MQRLNITDYILRPDTNWKPFLITNIGIIIYHMNFVLGKGKVIVPEHVKRSKSTISMTTNQKSVVYEDNLCAFRCLALHRNNDWLLLEIETQKLFEKWVSFNKTQDMKINSALQSFPGITLDQIVYFELFTNKNVNFQTQYI